MGPFYSVRGSTSRSLLLETEIRDPTATTSFGLRLIESVQYWSFNFSTNFALKYPGTTHPTWLSETMRIGCVAFVGRDNDPLALRVFTQDGIAIDALDIIVSFLMLVCQAFFLHHKYHEWRRTYPCRMIPRPRLSSFATTS